MSEYRTLEACNERHRPSKWLWGVAIFLLAGASTMMGVALTFALDARTEVWQVKTEIGKHTERIDERWIWTEKALKEIKADLRVLRNGHAVTESSIVDGEG